MDEKFVYGYNYAYLSANWCEGFRLVSNNMGREITIKYPNAF